MITQKRLKELFDYNPDTGVFTAKTHHGHRPRGSIAGNLDSRGYLRASLDNKEYRLHRLAWLYMTGEWPPNDLDHHDNTRTNNVWTNLRKATRSENLQNVGHHPKNTSGVKGVCWDKHANKWKAQISKNGKSIHIGLFVNKVDAEAEMLRQRNELHGTFANHGHA